MLGRSTCRRARGFRIIGTFLALVAFAAVVPRTASAEPTAAEIAVARKLFHDATELEQSGDHAGAAEKLREAIAIKETPGLRYHLAHVEEERGRLVEAMVEYDRAEELIRLGTEAPDVSEMIGPAKRALRERIPTLTISLPPSVDGARLSIDDAEVAPALAGKPIPLNPGNHQVIVSAPRRRDFRLELLLVEGEDRVVQAELQPRNEPGPAAPASPPPAGPAARADASDSSDFGAREIVLISEGVLTLAGAAVGVIYTLKRESEQDRAARARHTIDANVNVGARSQVCDNPTMFVDSDEKAAACQDLRSALSDSERAEDIALGGFIAGGVGLMALVGTWILWPTDSPETARVGVTPVAGGALSTIRVAF